MPSYKICTRCGCRARVPKDQSLKDDVYCKSCQDADPLGVRLLSERKTA